MIHPQPYRRPSLACDAPGCDLPVAGLAIACHKGNASQSQESTQVGAQTGGAAVSGTNDTGIGNSGNQVVITPPGGGFALFGSTAPKTSTISTTINNGISGQDIADFVTNLFSPAGTPPAGSTAAAAAASASDQSPAVTGPGPVTPLASIPKAVIVGGVLAVLAVVFGLVLILKPKRT